MLCPVEGHQDRWFVGGIVSWGVECATPSLPGVYVNVPMYSEWIATTIHKEELLSSVDDFGDDDDDDEGGDAIDDMIVDDY